MLDVDGLSEISVAVQETLSDKLEEILIKLNRTGQLEEFLSLIGMGALLSETGYGSRNRDGIIIVIGKSEVEKNILFAVAKSLGLDKKRFEFYLDYEDAKSFDFRKTQWSDAYSVILVGQMPHSGKAKGDYSSIITALEGQDGYPPVVRVGMKGLKITKESFKMTLEYLINQGIIV